MKISPLLTLLIVASASPMGIAQVRYNCTAKNGVSYASEKPCAPPSSAIVYYGPVAERQPTTYIPKMGEAPEHLPYLSPRCSSLSEGIRTGPARGVKYEVTASLQRDYQRECSEEDHDARARVNTEHTDAANAKKSSQHFAALTKEQALIKEQQCGESKRIIFSKKKRTDLTAGEQQELQRFIQNYKERCE
jgi:hypothetical protein